MRTVSGFRDAIFSWLANWKPNTGAAAKIWWEDIAELIGVANNHSWTVAFGLPRLAKIHIFDGIIPQSWLWWISGGNELLAQAHENVYKKASWPTVAGESRVKSHGRGSVQTFHIFPFCEEITHFQKKENREWGRMKRIWRGSAALFIILGWFKTSFLFFE